jgi:peptidoglycan-associated lipoprotein
MRIIAISLAIAVIAVAGCASKDEKQAEVTPTPGTGSKPPSSSTVPPTTTQRQPDSRLGGDPLRDPNSPLAKRSVYFDFDSNVVKDEYQGTVQAHSRYLGDKRDLRIRIEGNTDERGSREYNLALGQRRAEAVKKVMTVLGVQDGRVETISYGEEKPKSNGHDEQAWAQNRRADIKYPGE